MKVAVLGTGSIGRLHVELLAELDGDLELMVADVDRARAQAAAESSGASPVTPSQALAGADAVLIATPAESHRELVLAALERRIPIFCEKPLAADLPETLDLVVRVEAAGVPFQVGFQRRFDPGFAAARELVAGDVLGSVRLLRLTAHDPLQPVQPAPLSPLAPGEAAPLFRESSIHDFDLARWLTGSEAVEVVAEGSRRDDPWPSDPRRIETAVVLLRLDGGALAVLDATWLHPRGYDVRAELIGERDAVAVGIGPRMPARVIELTGELSPPWTTYQERFRGAYRAELVAFLFMARGEAASACTARDGLEAMRIAVAATRSAAERRAVALSEVPGLDA